MRDEHADATPRSLLRRFEERAEREGSRTALVTPRGEVSYAQLRSRVEALAMSLADRGAGPGRVVAFPADVEPETLVRLLATLRAGAAYLPYEASQPESRLRALFDDARPIVVLGPEAALAEAPAGEYAHDLAYVLFTSGSTGRPKGVMMPAPPLARLLAFHLGDARLGKPLRTLRFSPLGFDVHFQEIMPTLATGGTLVLPSEMQRRDPDALLALLDSGGVERMFLPYVALHLLADAALRANRWPASLRDVISAGEALRVTPGIRRFFERTGARLHNHYGPTETHVCIGMEVPGDAHDWPEMPAIGKPFPYVRAKLGAIADDESTDGSGELLLGGGCVANGYVARPELTAERFVTDESGGRWYRTGDRAAIAADGVIAFLGRIDQQVKIDGIRVEPAEAELALMELDGVASVAVAARELPPIGRQLVAWVVRAGPDAPDVAQLRAHARKRLPAYLQPSRYLFVERIPTTSNNKIDYRALPEPGRHEAGGAGGSLEDAVLATWRALLGHPTLARDENVFEHGARSLVVVRFVQALREQTGLAV
ncbi:MAG TPA: non-ribosomal peptide synthetase, partial [Xanthomonadales bacterium]|nr:non-ribosomal peptide synthetase [Xanthomonadales bacterium]